MKFASRALGRSRFPWAALWLTLGAAWVGAAQTVAPLQPAPQLEDRPAIQLLRFDEDWSQLKNPALRKDTLDRLKYIPLSKKSEAYLTLGGEFRGAYEDVLNDNWSAKPYPVNSFGLERYQLFADTHFNPNVRLFLQLESGLEQGRPGGSRPIDKKNLDFLNAFLDLSRGRATRQTRLRLGRQELQFGSGRLVAVREGPNVRQGFYGARFTKGLGSWSLDAFAARPAKDNPGFFDNVPQQTASFWGVFAERTIGSKPTHAFDVYYYGLDRKTATFDSGAAREQRQTVGARVATGPPNPQDRRLVIPHYDLEAVYQFGSFGTGSIRAWTIATESGVTFGRLPARPRVGLRADAASGSDARKSPNLQTFNPLFPIGNYFGILSDTGPGPLNVYDVHPDIRAFLPHNVSLDADWVVWWRQSLHDGVYGVPGNLLVASGQSQARFVGHRPGVELRWQRNEHFYVQADYGIFYAGKFLRDSDHRHNLNYASVWTGFKF